MAVTEQAGTVSCPHDIVLEFERVTLIDTSSLVEMRTPGNKA